MITIAKHSEYEDLSKDQHYYEVHLIKDTLVLKASSQSNTFLSDTAYPPTPHAGKYIHYKLNEYTVLAEAIMEDTLESYILYADTEDNVWIRPLVMFFETVLHNGIWIPRFTKVLT